MGEVQSRVLIGHANLDTPNASEPIVITITPTTSPSDGSFWVEQSDQIEPSDHWLIMAPSDSERAQVDTAQVRVVFGDFGVKPGIGPLTGFFAYADSKLINAPGVTSQYALRFLWRMRVLLAAIGAKYLPGLLIASVESDDSSTTIEWIRDHSRLGFVFDREDESSWFIILPDGSSRSGYLYGEERLPSLRELLAEFVAKSG
jgi:hypothetical protein